MARIEDTTSTVPDAGLVAPEGQATPTGNEGVTATSPDAAPSTDVKASEPQSMLEAAQQAIGTPSGSEETEAKTDPTTGQAPSPDAKADAKDDKDAEPDPSFLDKDPTDEEVGNYSRKAQSRIRDLIEQRNDASARAGRVEPILNFLERNDIPQEDLSVVLDLTARLRHGDFAGFLQGVAPYVDLARQYTGQVLPPDLQKQVQEGYVSPEIARELAQRRANEHVLRSQSTQREQRAQRDVGEATATVIRQTVSNWEQQIRAQDPDYDLKAEVVRRTAQALMQEHGVPQTADQALQYARRAYAEVNEQMKRLRPAPKPTPAVPSATSAARGNSTPNAEPSNMFEAAMQGLQAHRGGR